MQNLCIVQDGILYDNSLQLQAFLTVFIENTVLDVLGVLDPPLITSGLLMASNNLIFCRLLKYKIISLENGCKVETSPEDLSLYEKSPPSAAQIIYVFNV